MNETDQLKRQLHAAHNVLLAKCGQKCGIGSLKCEVCEEVEGWMFRLVSILSVNPVSEVAPEATPTLDAKRLTSINALLNRRIDLSIGFGHNPIDFRADLELWWGECKPWAASRSEAGNLLINSKAPVKEI